MRQEFWHNLITDKSFSALQDLRKKYDFVLIGGWAVFLYTQSLKSKDIDIIVDTATLGILKSNYDVIKNERLKKYEIKLEGFDVDIYLAHWSPLGLSASYIYENSISFEGFRVPKKEILFILKLLTYQQRKGSLKGKKDSLDIISLLYKSEIDFTSVKHIIKEFQLNNVEKELTDLLNSMVEVKELGLNRKKYSDFKKVILSDSRLSPL